MEDNVDLVKMVNLVHEAGKRGITVEEMWSLVVNQYQYIFIEKIHEKLNITINNTTMKVITTDDMVNGVELFYYQSYQQAETNVLLRFYNELILFYQDPRAIFKATINNMKQGVIRDKTNLEMVKLIYRKLEEIFDLQLGKIVIALSNREQLRRIQVDHDPPYLVKYKDEIRECLHHNCTRIDNLLFKFGKT